MFGKVAADVLGLSDIGSVIKPVDYDKVDVDDYVLHEDGEKIYFLIKSKSDEYCFTNQAFIHLDGQSATSKKRTLYRYDYFAHQISNVSLETAGNIDLDVEIKFTLGSTHFSIDVHKKHLEELKDLYKALLKIGQIARDNSTVLEFAKQSLQMASSTLSRNHSAEVNLVTEFKGINEVAFNWLLENQKKYNIRDFGHVFELYINN
ncbi:PH domain-containing protein [Hazenella coriacea]|uniref:YvbH-like protein n=1 Tax=Hazenella coriacea TaxID=1179467 RepID=A0A4V2UVV1_9BACL|nr:PH domain-containing protein [Hazenella coriacea]TCS96737.1 YvbH-like protein [Hazenella coriacea]